MEIAERIAAAIERTGWTANAWQGGEHVRVYAYYRGRDKGHYLTIDADGDVTGAGMWLGHAQMVAVEAAAAECGASVYA